MSETKEAINPLAAAKLAELRKGGCQLTDDDIIAVNDICRRITSPKARQEIARGRPVMAGGSVLWPYTLAGFEWFCSVGVDLPDPTAAMAYALAHGRDPAITEAGGADVARWRSGLTCTQDELMQAIVDVAAQDDRPDKPRARERSTMSAATLAMMMRKEFGGTAEEWENYCSLSYIFDMIDLLEAQSQAQGGLPELLVSRSNLALHTLCKTIKERGADEKAD